MGPKGGRSKDKGKDKGGQPAPVVEEESEEQDLIQQGEWEAEETAGETLTRVKCTVMLMKRH